MSRILLPASGLLKPIVVIAVAVLSACRSTPVPEATSHIHASQETAAIERGRYLVLGPAHCAACHGDPAREYRRRAGLEVPLSGGKVFDLGMLGSVVAPNITSDPVAGIGGLSDAVLVRSLRYGISHEGRPLVPLMSYAELSDADLGAILSFLRAQPPVARPARATHLTWLGTLALRIVLSPERPSGAPAVPAARTREYGSYLAHTVANCNGCHTVRSRRTGAFIGPPFAGGMKLEEPEGTFVSANLTPIAGGMMHDCTERQFIERFRTPRGDRLKSPMPWASFAHMTDTDLGAIYLYLKSLPAAATPRPE